MQAAKPIILQKFIEIGLLSNKKIYPKIIYLRHA